jgi:hypothetical protein
MQEMFHLTGVEDDGDKEVFGDPLNSICSTRIDSEDGHTRSFSQHLGHKLQKHTPPSLYFHFLSFNPYKVFK